MTSLSWQSLDDAERAQLWATLALKYSQGLGARAIKRILAHFGSAYVAIQKLEDWHKLGIKEDIISKVSAGAWREDALLEWRQAQGFDGRIVLWHHEQYPKLLKNIIDAPCLFYARGDLSLLSGPCLAIVGSRKCSAEGVEVASRITRDLAQIGITIVSGMAQGIDRVAHVAALSKIGKSVAVLGTGLDVIYPRQNTDVYYDLIKEGLVISEFSLQTHAIATNFPIRNRIISGVSLGVLVVEGASRSGTLITARQALEQNRDVFAIPGATTSLTSQGCQDLIRQGAKVVFNAEDILCDMAEQLKQYSDNIVKPLSTEAANDIKQNAAEIASDFLQEFPEDEQQDVKNILKFLYGNGESHIDSICMHLEQPIHQVNSLLMSMELAGIVKRLAGARYVARSA